MIVVNMWKTNQSRCGGRFNRYFFWGYPLILPFCILWDFLTWLERRLTP